MDGESSGSPSGSPSSSSTALSTGSTTEPEALLAAGLRGGELVLAEAPVPAADMAVVDAAASLPSTVSGGLRASPTHDSSLSPAQKMRLG